MTSLVELYENPEVSDGQKNYFWGQVNEIFSNSLDKKAVALKSLRYVWMRYDTGGISMGRSLRSLLLDKIISCMRSGNLEQAKNIIAVLVAMYHNDRYIERSEWYDFPLNFGLYGSSIDERIHLAVVAVALGVENNIPDILSFDKEKFFSFLK